MIRTFHYHLIWLISFIKLVEPVLQGKLYLTTYLFILIFF